MKWLEIITLRSSDMGNRATVAEVSKLAAEEKGSDRSPGIKIYRHASLETDVSIHLIHESEQGDLRPSILGQQLAAALKELGLVNHSLWVED